MKKIYTLGILIPLLAMTSCSNVHVLDKYHLNEGSLSYVSKAFTNYDVRFNSDKLNEYYDSYINAIQSKNISEINKYISLIRPLVASLEDKYCFAEVRYYANPTKDNEDTYFDLFDKYNASNLKNSLACDEANKTGDEEIKKLVLGNKEIVSSNPERESELYDILQTYYIKGEQLADSRSSYETIDDLIKAGISMFLEYAPYCDELGSLYNFDDYLEYSYKYDYHRAYKPSQSQDLISLVKQYFVPKYKEVDFSSYSQRDVERIKLSKLGCFALNSLNLGSEMDKYAKYVGGDYLKAYKHAFTDGYCVFSNVDNSMSTAATYGINNKSNGGILYFSKDYQDASSVMHEFGHYYSIEIDNYVLSKSYDINETFSQGNEMLFASYLLNNNKSDFLQGVAKISIDSFFKGLFKICYAVDVENYLFANYKSKTEDELFEGVTALYNSYNFPSLNKDYWIYPVFVSTGYYISYATSIVESLQLLSLANEDFETAYSVYMNLMKQTEKLGEVEAWERAGLTSPFKDSTMIEIVKYFD